MRGPRTLLMPQRLPNAPRYFARSARGTMSPIEMATSCMMPPPPTPCTPRHTASQVKFWAAAGVVWLVLLRRYLGGGRGKTNLRIARSQGGKWRYTQVRGLFGQRYRRVSRRSAPETRRSAGMLRDAGRGRTGEMLVSILWHVGVGEFENGAHRCRSMNIRWNKDGATVSMR